MENDDDTECVYLIDNKNNKIKIWDKDILSNRKGEVIVSNELKEKLKKIINKLHN